MKAAVIREHGDPDVFTIEDRPDPEAKPGEVVIRVKAAGVNFADLMARLGLYPDAPKPPIVVGYEVAGDIEKIGEGVSGFSIGQRVFTMTMFGGYAEKVAAPAFTVRIIPEKFTYEQAAAIPVNYLTAYHSLIYMGNLKPHEYVLIHSAAGGVGTAAVQIAGSVGATIIGTASPHKNDYLKQMGVSHIINYREMDFEKEVMRITEGRGADLIMDSLGGDQLMKNYNCLAPAGRLVTFGMFSIVKGDRRSMLRAMREVIKMGRFHPLKLFNANKAIIGVNMNHLATRPDIIGREMDAILNLIAEGRIQPHVDRTFPLQNVADAHRYIHDRKNKGKVILIV